MCLSSHMDSTLLTADDAATRFGISRTTLYDWLAQSDGGWFMLRGQAVTIDYLQGGRRGQGRIKIKRTEVDRLLELMRVKPKLTRTRVVPRPKAALTHITAKLGRPIDD